MTQQAAIGWLVRCGASAVVLSFAVGMAAARFSSGLQLPATTTRDGTLLTLNQYAQGPTPDVVIVGSSLGFRLKEEYFRTPKLRNLALAGGSPVTGLEIVTEQARLPRLVLVEANILSRATDTALVEKYAGGRGRDPLLSRPVRTAVAAYENWNHAPVTHAQVSLALAQWLKQPPSDFDNHVYAERALKDFNAENPTAAARVNVRRIQQLIGTLEQKGTRVLLFEVPYSEPIENSRSATISRDIIHGEFPDASRWLTIDTPHDELRWSDGVHLDERSAVMVAQQIDSLIGPMLGAR